MAGKWKKPETRSEPSPQEQPQPGLHAGRTMLKLDPATRDLLKQLAAYRGETMLLTVRALVVQEIERNADTMKQQIDRLVVEARTAPPPKHEDD